MTCSISRCRKPIYCRLWCRMHYTRWLRHGDPLVNRKPKRPPGMSVDEVVAREIVLAITSGSCELSSLAPGTGGYPAVAIGRRTTPLHRLVLARRLGRPLRGGEQALHRCHRPACINPDHLYPGTHSDNMRHKAAAGRAPGFPGEANPSSRLSAESVNEIRNRHAAGDGTYRGLGVEFGVASTTIARIIRSETWRDGDGQVCD